MKMTILRELWIWMKDAVWFLRISRPGVRVPSIAPENAVRSKDFMAFLFFATQLHGFCTVGARFVFSVLNYVGRGIALQSVPFFAFRSTVQGEAVPSFQGLHLSGAPKARPWRALCSPGQAEFGRWLLVWRRKNFQTFCPAPCGKTAGYGRKC